MKKVENGKNVVVHYTGKFEDGSVFDSSLTEGREPIKVNVRIITATHQNIEDLVKEGLFREDLFHRLNVIKISLPNLNERKEDIPLLVKHFFHKSSEELKEGKEIAQNLKEKRLETINKFIKKQ